METEVVIGYTRWTVLDGRNYWECTRCGALVSEDLRDAHTDHHEHVDRILELIVTATNNLI